jgi:hypothetical protein
MGLNPSSSSRFTLSLPLLGRAKVPLGSVLGKKEKEKGMSGFVFDCWRLKRPASLSRGFVSEMRMIPFANVLCSPSLLTGFSGLCAHLLSSEGKQEYFLLPSFPPHSRARHPGCIFSTHPPPILSFFCH